MSLHPYYPRFTYFNQQLKNVNWSTDKILDYGGNWGNLLRDPDSTIPPSNYWCVDVSSDAIEQGKKDYPDAHWFHYNKWNHCYNSKGDKSTKLPNFETKFNLITAFSVVTHVTEEDMLEIIYEDLFPLLEPNGILAFTLLEPSALIYFSSKRGLGLASSSKLITQAAKHKQGFYYINDNIVCGVEESLPLESSDFFVSFYSIERAKELFKKNLVEIKKSSNNELQYSVILKNHPGQAE